MPDRRKHRGPHPEDARLFAPSWHPRLRRACAELSELLGWGYAMNAATTLVGDRHQLHRRQRLALKRSAVAPEAARERRARLGGLAGERVAMDGFNILVTAEAALAGAVLLRGRDGRLRDLASVHGTWRRMEETSRALGLLAEILAPAAEVRWVLDRPVSNSGRLAGWIRERGWQAELSERADTRLRALGLEGWRVATADGPLLDGLPASCDPIAALLADPALTGVQEQIVDLSVGSTGPEDLRHGEERRLS